MGFGDIIKEHRDRIKNLLDKLTNDSHVPIALIVFITTSVYHFHTGKDLGTNYTNSIYALYGFLGGHAAIYQKWPDQPVAPAAAPTVDVNVTNDNSNANSANASASTPPQPTPPAPVPDPSAATGSAGDKG